MDQELFIAIKNSEPRHLLVCSTSGLEIDLPITGVGYLIILRGILWINLGLKSVGILKARSSDVFPFG